MLDRIMALPHHLFWHDEISLSKTELIARPRLVGHRQVADAHLLAVALSHGGRLATFDRGILQLVPEFSYDGGGG